MRKFKPLFKTFWRRFWFLTSHLVTAVVSELQLGPHVVLKSLCRHTYYIGACSVSVFFFWTQI